MPFSAIAPLAAAGIGAAISGSGGDGGSAPSVSNQPSISPQQQQLMQFLFPLLQARGIDPAQFGGQFAAPMSGLEGSSLAALEQGVLPGATQNAQAGGKTVGSANTALQSILARGPDQSAQAFDTAVAQPLMKNFNERVIPSLESAYGANAGGPRSSDFLNTLQRSTEDLNKTLSSSAAAFSLADTKNVLGAAAEAPGLSNAGGVSPLMQLLQAGGLPRQIQQTQLTGQYGEFQRQQNQQSDFVTQMLQAIGMPTQNAVVQPGQQGFLSAMAPGFGAAVGEGFANADWQGAGSGLWNWLFK